MLSAIPRTVEVSIKSSAVPQEVGTQDDGVSHQAGLPTVIASDLVAAVRQRVCDRKGAIMVRLSGARGGACPGDHGETRKTLSATVG